MRELFVTTRTACFADGRQAVCDYYILIDQMDVRGGFSCESYGVRVVGREGIEGDVSIPNITVSISRIDALMEQLTRGFVTPAAVDDIVADWL